MEKPKAIPVIKLLATPQELEAISDLAGGERQVSNYLRKLIREDAQKQGKELEPEIFAQRPPGNKTRGDTRKGGKENRQFLTAINALAV